MTRYQKLVAATVATTFVLVVIGVVVRATNSGVACPAWPGCFPASSCRASMPGRTSGSSGSTGRWRSSSGSSSSAVAVLAFIDHRDRPSILWPSLAAVAIALFQAYLGQETVRLGNSGPSVTAHLATAMILFAVLDLRAHEELLSGAHRRPRSSQRFTLLAVFGTLATYGLILFGSNVTAGGERRPRLQRLATDERLVLPDADGDLTSAQVLHRWVAVVVGLIVVATAVVAWRTPARASALVRAWRSLRPCCTRSRSSSAGCRS